MIHDLSIGLLFFACLCAALSLSLPASWCVLCCGSIDRCPRRGRKGIVTSSSWNAHGDGATSACERDRLGERERGRGEGRVRRTLPHSSLCSTRLCPCSAATLLRRALAGSIGQQQQKASLRQWSRHIHGVDAMRAVMIHPPSSTSVQTGSHSGVWCAALLLCCGTLSSQTLILSVAVRPCDILFLSGFHSRPTWWWVCARSVSPHTPTHRHPIRRPDWRARRPASGGLATLILGCCCCLVCPFFGAAVSFGRHSYTMMRVIVTQ